VNLIKQTNGVDSRGKKSSGKQSRSNGAGYQALDLGWVLEVHGRIAATVDTMVKVPQEKKVFLGLGSEAALHIEDNGLGGAEMLPRDAVKKITGTARG